MSLWSRSGALPLRRRVALLAFALALLVIVPAAARAAENGGTQSVFATGAGNRALGMGSAFVATADDASALLWNPGGLGILRRGELQAVQTGDLGAGFHETYASAAMTNWRWGSVALGYRQFGVSGIEQRDERNTLIASDLSDSQSELAIGYGRAVGEAWSVGASMKFQSIAVAGYRGSGFGVDLGALVKPAQAFGYDADWAAPLRWGFAIRNAVESSIRLDRESVRDPAAMRTGVAWEAPMGAADALLVEVDFERARDAGSRLRAGAEYRLRTLGALRLGLNGSRLTAGTGVRWRELALDYAFEDGELGAAHRVGVTMPFGHTVVESREAARRAEDEALQERLAEAFQARQRERVASLLEQAETHLRGGNAAAALDALAILGAIEPDLPAARALESSCLSAKATELEGAGDHAAAALTWERAASLAPSDSTLIARARAARVESDARASRTTEIGALFARAMDALASDDVIAARAAFREVLERNPGDADAGRMLARVEEMRASRASRALEQAARYADAGMIDQAEAQLARARTFEAEGPALARAAAALRGRKDAIAREGAPGGGRAPSGVSPSPSATASPGSPAARGGKMTDREVEDLYRRGLDAMRRGQTEDAIRFWELVWSSRPGYRGVGEHLKREYLTRGMEAFGSGNLEQAAGWWKRVLAIDPNDARAKNYMERAQTGIARSKEIFGVRK